MDLLSPIWGSRTYCKEVMTAIYFNLLTIRSARTIILSDLTKKVLLKRNMSGLFHIKMGQC